MLPESKVIIIILIKVISVRTTKPRIPSYVMENYENMEIEKLKLQINKVSQRVTEKCIYKLNILIRIGNSYLGKQGQG